jgi:guanosine-3',5'-bis(diphosphate) 3'-pyrophosphohydrolase
MLTKEPELQGSGLRGGVMEFSKLLEKVKGYLPAEKIAVVEEAYKFASEKHQGQMRLSGEPFLEHPLQTAYVLAELQFDASSLAAALLHDIPEDTASVRK